jgi:hypothetical protein
MSTICAVLRLWLSVHWQEIRTVNYWSRKIQKFCLNCLICCVVFRMLWGACNQRSLTDCTVIFHSLADWLGNFLHAVHTVGLFNTVVFWHVMKIEGIIIWLECDCNWFYWTLQGSIVLSLTHTVCSSLQHVLTQLSLLCLHQSLPGDGFQQCPLFLCSHSYQFVTAPQLTHCFSCPAYNILAQTI